VLTAEGLYEIPFLDRMGIVFIFCLAGMFIISKIENARGVVPNGLAVDKKMFKIYPGFAVGALIICGILAALFTMFW
jgi:SSS family solute:Na+ symporter